MSIFVRRIVIFVIGVVCLLVLVYVWNKWRINLFVMKKRLSLLGKICGSFGVSYMMRMFLILKIVLMLIILFGNLKLNWSCVGLNFFFIKLLNINLIVCCIIISYYSYW